MSIDHAEAAQLKEDLEWARDRARWWGFDAATWWIMPTDDTLGLVGVTPIELAERFGACAGRSYANALHYADQAEALAPELAGQLAETERRIAEPVDGA